MIWAFEVASADPQFSRNFYQVALAQGLLLRPIGNTVYFMPPYVLGENEMALLAEQVPVLLDRVQP
jgi:adenosylmethionine-8-amino-7-oxononanoate aminotransferase